MGNTRAPNGLSFGVGLADEIVEAGLLLEAVHAGRSGGFGLQAEAHALVAAVLRRRVGLMRSRLMLSLSHQTESLERL